MVISSRVVGAWVAVVIGCWLMLECVGGQERSVREPAKKEKGRPKDNSNPEDKAVSKTLEKASKGLETERDKWLKELNKAFPGKVSPGQTPADFAQWYELLAGAGDWQRHSASPKPLAELFDRVAGRLNLGEASSIRREEFLEYARRFLQPGASPPWKDPLDEARKVFQQLDRDSSGWLEPAEWSERLRAQARDYDADRDGRISFPEYRAYFEGRVVRIMTTGTDEPLSATSPAPGGEANIPSGRFPTPIRYGQLPSGLPKWFVDLDTDRDGQISLYEWKSEGYSLAEFQALDLNGDGLLPPEEYLRYLRYHAPAATGPATATPTAPANAAASSPRINTRR
ncbi:MAG: hypothetical protein RMJ56_02235 [Gemmataceae bacterium]|nr:hypothetical protein [Gemmata sp.]MDW8196404.1 hypothetical protein [Gemmataceae bacterium]